VPFGFGKGRGSAKMIKQGRAGKRRGMGGFGQGGPPTNCICPQCSLVVPHEPGIPCFQRKCPQCGSFMARQFLKIE
jgi:hypothetical protein